MTMNRWQFSLRRAFVWMTLIAAFTAFVANFPRVALVCFSFSLIFFASRGIPLLLERAPGIFRPVLVFQGSLLLAGAAYVVLVLARPEEYREFGFWMFLVLIIGMSLCSLWVAWMIPGGKQQKTTRIDDTPR